MYFNSNLNSNLTNSEKSEINNLDSILNSQKDLLNRLIKNPALYYSASFISEDESLRYKLLSSWNNLNLKSQSAIYNQFINVLSQYKADLTLMVNNSNLLSTYKSIGYNIIDQLISGHKDVIITTMAHKPDLSGNNLSNAKSIDNGSFVKEFVHYNIDATDYYQFSLANKSNIQLDFQNIIGQNGLVSLLDEKGNVIDYTTLSENTNNFAYNNLNVGHYYLQFKNASNHDNIFYYEFSTTINPIIEANPVVVQSVETPQTTVINKINTLENPVKITNVKNYKMNAKVSADQPSDYYQFNLTKTGTFNFKLKNLTEDANLILFKKSTNATPKLIKSSKKMGTSDESFNKLKLTKGTYILQVTNVNNSSTSYNLSINQISTANGFPQRIDLTLDQTTQATSILTENSLKIDEFKSMTTSVQKSTNLLNYKDNNLLAISSS